MSGEPLRVLLVVPAADGGLLAHVRLESAVLSELGSTVEDAAVRIRPRPDPREDPRTILRLRRRIAAGDLDAVHAHGLRAGALTALAMTGPGRRRRAGTPRLVVTLHNRTVGSRAARSLGHLLLQIIARRADVVLAVSPDLADAARRAGAHDVRHAIVPAEPASDENPVVPPERADGRLRILVAARLAAQKGLDDLLDAIAVLEARGRGEIAVDVVGEGPQRDRLEERIRAERLPVRLLGRRDDIPRRLREADLVVSSSHWEGQPVFLQEALHAGAAIVATDAGGTRWVTGEAARLVPVADPAALAAAIAEHREAVVRDRARERSRERAAQLPGRADLTRQLLGVLAPAGARW